MSAPHHDASAAAHAGEQAPSTVTVSTLITVWLVLAFLTAIEIVVPSVYNAEWNHHLRVWLLVVLSVGKAWLVAAYFMHLKWERPWLRIIAMLPAYMAVFTAILMTEQVWRGLVR